VERHARGRSDVERSGVESYAANPHPEATSANFHKKRGTTNQPANVSLKS
jgi:hypothetical protein